MAEDTIPQMRDAIDRLQKDLKSVTTERDQLKSQARTLSGREAAREAQLDPKFGELFAQTADGEITSDAVAEFAKEYGLPVGATAEPAGEEVATEEAEGTAAEPKGSAELAQMARGGSSSGEGAGSATEETMTRAEWTALTRTDPAAARAALAKGRVQISSDNPYAGGNQRPGNPFAKADA